MNIVNVLPIDAENKTAKTNANLSTAEAVAAIPWCLLSLAKWIFINQFCTDILLITTTVSWQSEQIVFVVVGERNNGPLPIRSRPHSRTTARSMSIVRVDWYLLWLEKPIKLPYLMLLLLTVCLKRFPRSVDRFRQDSCGCGQDFWRNSIGGEQRERERPIRITCFSSKQYLLDCPCSAHDVSSCSCLLFGLSFFLNKYVQAYARTARRSREGGWGVLHCTAA